MENSKAILKSSTGGVRIVGKIRPFLESEDNTDTASHIEVSRIDSDSASISFGDQSNRRDIYKLDWCYGQDENTDMIFSKEIIPLIHETVEGYNNCVISYGARGSGKTQLIKGSEENPGLALMAVSKILSISEELNGLVTVSCYDVYQDRVYDLLDPKVPEVLVMEDASRKIMLKGLSQVPVKSTSDFLSYYFHGCNERKSSQNGVNEVSSRSHKGLIITLTHVDKEANKSWIGKMNLIDLAGYEDTKRNNFSKTALNEITRVNKSLYALLNVICSLNSNGTYIPYRETRLTHLLQDFLSKTSNAVLFTCLNPKPCPDTIHAVCLASRSCQAVNKLKCDSAKSNKSASRIPNSPSASRSFQAVSKLNSDSAKSKKSASRIIPSSPLKGNVRALQSSVRKLEISHSLDMKFSWSSPITIKRPQPLSLSQKKAGVHGSTAQKVNEVPSTPKGRMMSNLKSQISDSAKKLSTEDEVTSSSNVYTESPIIKEVVNEDEKSSANGCNLKLTVSEEICHDTDVQTEMKEESEVSDVSNPDSFDMHDNQKQTMAPSAEYSTITEKLREISNTLKLASSKSMDFSSMNNVTTESKEPKTPKTPHLKSEEIGTPQDILKVRSIGLKKSLIQECLNFVNSASEEELMKLKGIGKRRALYIIERREEQPFRDVEDMKKRLVIGSKQIREMISQLLGDF